jgi:hypothetical protein
MVMPHMFAQCGNSPAWQPGNGRQMISYMSTNAFRHVNTLWRRYRSAPRLLRLFFEQAALGAVIGLTLATALVYYNVANLQSLIFGSDIWLAASFLFFFTFALTFAAAMIATAMLLNIE